MHKAQIVPGTQEVLEKCWLLLVILTFILSMIRFPSVMPKTRGILCGCVIDPQIVLASVLSVVVFDVF